nr:hypothetical protein [Tanacetum cinerariifolium]GEY03242.1 hypothetical protein [Tanacetum cinerariifolium]
MDDYNTTMEEYVRLETERAIRNGKVYNRETTTYGKIRYVDDINNIKFFETEFPATIYDDTLKFELELSSVPTVSPQHVDEVNLDFEISFAESDDDDYTFIYDNDSFSYKLISVNDLKSDTDNDNGKFDIKQSLEDVFIEPSHNVISIDVGTYAQGSNKLLETSHDTISNFFTAKTFIKELCVNVMSWNYLNE